MGVMKPDLVMKSIIPVVMAGVLGIYGLIIAVIIANGGAQSARIVLFFFSPPFSSPRSTRLRQHPRAASSRSPAPTCNTGRPSAPRGRIASRSAHLAFSSSRPLSLHGVQSHRRLAA